MSPMTLHLSEYHREYRRRNSARIKAHLAVWRETHPDRLKEHRETARYRRSGPRRPRPANPTDPAALGWTAGIIDGEGHIGIARFRPRHDPLNYNYVLRVSVAGTDPQMIERLYTLWGGTLGLNKQRLRSGRLLSRWTVGAMRAAEVLRAVRPHLVTKAAQADIAFEFRAKALRKPRNGARYREVLMQMKRPPTDVAPSA